MYCVRQHIGFYNCECSRLRSFVHANYKHTPYECLFGVRGQGQIKVRSRSEQGQIKVRSRSDQGQIKARHQSTVSRQQSRECLDWPRASHIKIVLTYSMAWCDARLLTATLRFVGRRTKPLLLWCAEQPGFPSVGLIRGFHRTSR